ncbi:hypothetical protein N9B14_01420 [Akkermansiaceae bacterium]|jgi:hypothetical protein|nr:hypothetical protein [Akkermansiaceae bacterium]
MIQALIGPIASLAGSWMESKVEQTKAKGVVAKAKAEAEAQVMVTAATHEAGWEKIMAQASDNSWKDEAWTILFIVIIAMCFIPFTQPYVERGFEALSNTPAWFQYAVYASIAASFGLRGLKGIKR